MENQERIDEKEQEKVQEETSIINFNDIMDKPKVQEQVQEKTIVEKLHDAAIVNEVKTNEEVREQIVEQAKKTIKQDIKKIDSANESKTQKAIYDANKEACQCYGIEGNVPTWQVRLMKIGHSIWFIVYWLFATVTICPVNVFAKGIKAFIKNTWVALIFALLCYLIIVVGIPLLVAFLNKQGIEIPSLQGE